MGCIHSSSTLEEFVADPPHALADVSTHVDANTVHPPLPRHTPDVEPEPAHQVPIAQDLRREAKDDMHRLSDNETGVEDVPEDGAVRLPVGPSASHGEDQNADPSTDTSRPSIPQNVNNDPGPFNLDENFQGLADMLGNNSEEAPFENSPRAVKMFTISSAGSSVDDLSEKELSECGIDVKGLGPGGLNAFRKDLHSIFSPFLSSSMTAILSSAASVLFGVNQDLHSHGMQGQVALCTELHQSSSKYVIYYFLHFDPLLHQDGARQRELTFKRYGSIGDGLQKLDILVLGNQHDFKTEISTISLFPEDSAGLDLKICTA
ncbi:hypothetical protein CPB84DRAFT_1787401 [Gymnopilus junonius]|uniref:Uncharacterized protein n=1 Tax=Gymnopilus junonius TaxID=109634 RepID=A0A9P5NI49_GYMJU|nr:hypothetical protein CPB84DRAFT_1787401 [Gymnopilus junonius]